MSGGLPREGEEDEVAAEINVTPFIDVMLVLLIVFMVAAPLSTVDVPVTLPTSSAAPQDRPEEPIWMTVTAEGVWSVGETEVAPEGLAPALEAASGGDRSRAVLIRGDAALPYGQMMEVLDALRAAGFLKVALVGTEEAGG
ncbi:TonB system transport protein ExbD [Tabrizicola sp. TH137]|uniref:TonB system transport protein ExbD n=1 Tax=Tabrizicola sp. TH137 TaxID=2067452 RepID=UPI001C200CCF|nr:TonB system transport protein ExbD [Tabrizicola sp. TH137]